MRTVILIWQMSSVRWRPSGILVCLSAVERGLGFLRISDPGSAIVGVAIRDQIGTGLRGIPTVDQLAPAAAKQRIKWAEEIKAAEDKGAPFE
jgi:hypothetical protein